MKKQNVFNSLLIALAIATLFFGFWGWQSIANSLQINTGDAIYRAIDALLLSDSYETSANWQHDWRVELSRWLGLFTFILGASKAITILLADHLKAFAAKRRKQHLLLIGDDPFATAIASVTTENGYEVNWLHGHEQLSTDKNKLLYISSDIWSLAAARQNGLDQANKAVIAMPDDAKAIAIARQLREAIPNEDQLQIFVTIGSPWIAQHIDDLKGVTGLHIFSRASAAARALHRKHPPFLIAKQHHQSRIHNLIVGFGQHGEAMLIDLLLSCLTTYLSKPIVSIIDNNANNIKAQLALRYPELEKSIELNFIEGALQGDEANLSEAAIQTLAHNHPFTAACVCFADDSLSLSTALALRTITLHHQLIAGPIFTRLSSNNNLPKVEAGTSHIEAGQLIAYGALPQLVGETGILNDDADGLAKVMHQAYCKVSDDQNAANVSWNDLAEDKRDANRRLIPHICAKLSSAGYDVEPWLKAIDNKPNIANLPYIADFAQADAVLEKLAALEHERWMADRRINGWRLTDDKRDDTRKLHTDLVPFDALSETSQHYDRVMIQQLGVILADKSNQIV